ncbi:MAG: MarR family transcriptional regulator [Oscillochloris sp.]|nr:MarR family transcriptional regulator [Oscillochloris sp.]
MTERACDHAVAQHRLIQEIYVLLDDGDRRVLDGVKLTTMEFALLNRLHHEQGQRLTDIGAELLCVKSTITRLVDRLEMAGLVQRTPDPDDRRAQRLVITEHGEVVRSRARALHSNAVERRLGVLSPDEQHRLYDLLAKLRNGLEVR